MNKLNKLSKQELIDEVNRLRKLNEENNTFPETGEIFIDITEGKKAQQALEYAENIIATIHEPLVVLDKELRVVSASSSFYNDYKVKEKETVGQLIYNLGNKQWDIPKLRDLLEDILPKNKTFKNFEVEHDFESIGQRTMILNARCILSKGSNVEMILLAIQDITDKKNVELEIKKLNNNLEMTVKIRTAQLEFANKELEAFSYSVSHDLRAPIRAIDGFTRRLSENYSNVLDDEGKRLLGVVLRSTKNMGQLIDDLLTFSRLGRKKIETTLIDMNELVKEVVIELNNSNENRKLNINIKQQLPQVNGDRALIRQVIVNLLANSIKFTKNRETATIEFGNLTLDHQDVFYVKDNGVGFDMKYVHKIFDVFQRLHSVKEFEGTGVGLAIVQKIIHRHGGRIRAEAEINKGATFYFSLTNIKE